MDTLLQIDPVGETARICVAIRRHLRDTLRRRGAVVAVSGGIDSAVALGLTVQALGPERVLALLLPERDSSPETLVLGRRVAERFGIERVEEDITGVLESLGHYRRYDDAVRTVVPEYGEGWTSKLTTSNVLTGTGYTVFSLVAHSPQGRTVTRRVPLQPYLEVLAAMNFKQRVRKVLEYHHAERRHYAVVGTPNRLEYDQGFFVKNGDGSADFKPIAHLYKSQVYEMADYLELPAAVRNRTATTDTFSLPQSQEEFYFGVPLRLLDLCVYAKQHAISADEAALALGEARERISAIYAAIDAKRKATAYLHEAPLLVEPVALTDSSASGGQ
jgi:NAD+ synthase